MRWRALNFARASGGAFTTKEVADALDINSKHASTVLLVLQTRGNVVRVNQGSGPGVWARWKAVENDWRNENEEEDNDW